MHRAQSLLNHHRGLEGQSRRRELSVFLSFFITIYSKEQKKCFEIEIECVFNRCVDARFNGASYKAETRKTLKARL